MKMPIQTQREAAEDALCVPSSSTATSLESVDEIKLLESLISAVGRLLPVAQALGKGQLSALQRILIQQEHLAGLCGQLQQHQQQLETQLHQVGQRLETHGYNVEQLRLSVDALGRQFGELKSDCIERQVIEPVCKEMARSYGALWGLLDLEDNLKNSEIKNLAGRLEQMLDSFGLRLINPKSGDGFNPREHEPIGECETSDAQFHRRIASTCRVGLYSAKRVVQTAKVKVFVVRPPNNPS